MLDDEVVKLFVVGLKFFSEVMLEYKNFLFFKDFMLYFG